MWSLTSFFSYLPRSLIVLASKPLHLRNHYIHKLKLHIPSFLQILLLNPIRPPILQSLLLLIPSLYLDLNLLHHLLNQKLSYLICQPTHILCKKEQKSKIYKPKCPLLLRSQTLSMKLTTWTLEESHERWVFSIAKEWHFVPSPPTN